MIGSVDWIGADVASVSDSFTLNDDQAQVSPEEVKRCHRCDRELPSSAFSKRSGRAGGLQARCKECRHDIYVADKDRISELYKANRTAFPEKSREKQRKYYQANRDSVLAKNRAWAEGNPARMAEYAHEWHLRNPEKRRDTARRLRARKRGARIESFSDADLRSYWESIGIDTRSCIYCEGDFEHRDHVIPLAAGGAHSRANLVPSCADCNRRKKTKSVAAFKPGHPLARYTQDICDAAGLLYVELGKAAVRHGETVDFTKIERSLGVFMAVAQGRTADMVRTTALQAANPALDLSSLSDKVSALAAVAEQAASIDAEN